MLKHYGRRLLGYLTAAMMMFLPTTSMAQVDINFAYTPVSGNLAVYVAKDQGFFEKRGLNVSPVIVANGALITAAVVAGSSQIGAPTFPVFLQAVDAGIDEVIVSGGEAYPSGNTNIIARTDAGIKSANDLVGKKVAVPGLNGFLHILVRKWLLDAGVDETKVNFIEVSFPQIGDALKSGQVDATILVDPFHDRVLNAGNAVVVGDVVSSVPKNTSGVVHVTMRQWAEANSEAVKAWKQALIEANTFIADPQNEQSVRESFSKWTKLPPEIVANLPFPNLVPDVTVDQARFWSELAVTLKLINGTLDPQALLAE